MNRIFKWTALVVLLLAVVAGAAFYSAFGRNRSIVAGQELAPGVTTVKDGMVAPLLLDAGGGKFALFDAGKDKSGEAILDALKQHGAQPSSVSAIFVTHGHRDHTAACRLFPSAQVYAMGSEVALIGDAAHVTHPLKDGEAVQVGSLRVEAFATPGHTQGSVVYLANGVLFFGDSARGGKDGSVMPAVRLLSKDPAQNVASLKKLASLLTPRASEVKVLAFAHSGPLDGFEPLAAFARTH
jgi:glyoxylase-like metal-dependent hydrolase (beta-lactamase superfamily II)